MDFLSTPPRDVPKGTAQCLAVVTIGGAAANGGRRGSAGSNEGDEGGLQRVLSGGRRRSVAAGAGAADKGEGTGTWYWPARVGITDVSPVANSSNKAGYTCHSSRVVPAQWSPQD